MEISESELVGRARAGDAEAFAALVQRYRVGITRLLRRLVDRTEPAEDLAQETFLAAFERLDSLRDPDRFGPWLRSIAVNAARQWWRREAQISFEPLWDEADPGLLQAHRPHDAGSERIRELVREALAALPPEPRTAVLLHYFDGYDYGEIAALLDVPVSTVRGRLHVARRRLREEMAALSPARKKSEGPEMVTQEFVLTAADVAAVRGAELLASRDPERPALQSICFEPDGTLVSTDVHRLYLCRGSSIRPAARVLVSRRLFDGLQHRHGLRSARLTLTAEEATLHSVDERDAPVERLHRAPLLREERFPRYDRVIPTDWKLCACLSARDLLAALDEVARFEAFLSATALPDRGCIGSRVTLTFCADAETVFVQAGAIRTDPTPAQWVMQAEISVSLEGLPPGGEFTIALNRAYLRECLKALDITGGQPVEMRFNGAILPVRLSPEGTEDRFIVLMPMSLDIAEPTPFRTAYEQPSPPAT